MKSISKDDIKKGLKKLGLSSGDHVIVHSALGSFGEVAGGADAIIDALLETVGEEGTVLMPTFESPDVIFDITKSRTDLGAIPQAFWQRPGAHRSRHPHASLTAVGKKARWFVEGHETAKTAHCENTPYGKIAQMGGKVLLLGVDQDRNTFLHTAESMAKLPYLKPIKGSFLDAAGKAQTKSWSYFPGPHRNFIGLQEWLESVELVKKTHIGNCQAQIMNCRDVLQALQARLEYEPGLFISNNPNLPDGIRQKADILRAVLKKEAFTTAADSQFAGQYIEEIIENLKRFGIDNVVLSFINDTPWDKIDAHIRRWYLQGLKNAAIKVSALKLATFEVDKALALLSQARCRTLIVPSTCVDKEKISKAAVAGITVCVENLGISSPAAVRQVEELGKGKPQVKIAFNPLAYVQVGENPFLYTYSKTPIKKYTHLLYINDGLATGRRTPLEEGLAEIKELISILRCRSFSGLFVLQGEKISSFHQTAVKFFDMLRELGQCQAK